MNGFLNRTEAGKALARVLARKAFDDPIIRPLAACIDLGQPIRAAIVAGTGNPEMRSRPMKRSEPQLRSRHEPTV